MRRVECGGASGDQIQAWGLFILLRHLWHLCPPSPPHSFQPTAPGGQRLCGDVARGPWADPGQAGGLITLVAPTRVGTHLDRDAVQGECFTGVPVGGAGGGEQRGTGCSEQSQGLSGPWGARQGE